MTLCKLFKIPKTPETEVQTQKANRTERKLAKNK